MNPPETEGLVIPTVIKLGQKEVWVVVVAVAAMALVWMTAVAVIAAVVTSCTERKLSAHPW